MVSVGRFRLAYPEFRETSDSLIEQKIKQAEAFTSSTAYGERRVYAVMLQTAHLLALSPNGAKARLQKDKESTIYGKELKMMARKSTMGLGRIV